MVCQRCGYESRADARFCGGCGAPLAALAAAPMRLAERSDPRSYTPQHLAERILRGRRDLEGERKQVTVLFADVKGSMELAEQLDPEQWHRIMDRFFALLAEGVHRFEGTVNQYTGDGIMALFGAPIGHEDHAQRACYAALHLRDALRRYAQELRRERGFDFSVRMGLNSGEVVIGSIGDDLRMEYTAQGHTVGLAARMEQLAEAGAIYLTEQTASIVAGFFRVEDLGPFTIKGVHAPVHVLSLLGPGPMQSRFDVARARGLSRFVGRSSESEQLDAALTATAQRNGQVIGVVGEPGVGKSRLCFEFIQRARHAGIPIYEAHCVPHGKTVPFLPVLGLVRSYFGLTDQDSDGESRRKIAGTVLLLDASLTDSLPLIFDFLGVAEPSQTLTISDPIARQRQLFTMLSKLIHARSESAPAVLWFEDLHWLDPASEIFLEALIEGLRGTCLLCLVNYRPEYRSGWMQSQRFSALQVTPLSPAAIDELLADLLGDGPALEPVAALIRERAGGNPFFVEEVVRSLVDQKILTPLEQVPAGAASAARARYALTRSLADVQIPATIQAVLAARIDRLSEREKRVLQAAAVIGRRFWEPVLRRIMGLPEADLGDALMSLTSAAFVDSEALYPEAQYAFNHPLTREVAYHSLLGEQRARIHGGVARAIADLYPDRLDERAALLAYHWSGAGDAREAAIWSQRAAEWMRRTGNLTEALQYWRNVCDLLRPLVATTERDTRIAEACIRILESGWRLGIGDSEAAARMQEGEALAGGVGDKAALARLLSAYATVKSHRGDADVWIEHCRRAVALADEAADAGLQLATRNRLVLSLGFAGRLREALPLVRDTIAHPPADPDLGHNLLGYRPFVRMVEQHARCLIEMARLEEGEIELMRAAQLAHSHGDLEVLGWIHGQYVSLGRIRGDAPTAVTHAREALRLAERLGGPFFRAGASLAFGQAHILMGQWAEARAQLETTAAIARDGLAAVETEPLALAWLAAAHLGTGNLERARDAATSALRVAHQRRTRLAECIAHIGLARVLLRSDGIGARDAIASELEAAAALIEETGATSNEPFIRVQKARLAWVVGDGATWQREMSAARALFTQMGASARAAKLP